MTEGTLGGDTEHDRRGEVVPPVERPKGLGQVQLNKLVRSGIARRIRFR